MRKYVLLVAVGLMALGLLAGPAGAVAGRTFTLTLSGDVGPVPGDPDGSGTATISVNPGTETVCYEIAVEDIAAPQEPGPGVGSAHIHFGSVTETGGIAVDLKANFQPTENGFAASGCVTGVDRGLLVDIIVNPENYYLNIHNAEFPDGALRAQLA
jgi:CHRD domain